MRVGRNTRRHPRHYGCGQSTRHDGTGALTCVHNPPLQKRTNRDIVGGKSIRTKNSCSRQAIPCRRRKARQVSAGAWSDCLHLCLPGRVHTRGVGAPVARAHCLITLPKTDGRWQRLWNGDVINDALRGGSFRAFRYPHHRFEQTSSAHGNFAGASERQGSRQRGHGRA